MPKRRSNRAPSGYGVTASGYVLRGDDANNARKAIVQSDLIMSPFAGMDYADPRLVDPKMHDLVEEARAGARELGYRDGHAVGYEDGRREGLEMMSGEIEKIKASAAAEAQRHRAEFGDLIGRLERAVDSAVQYQMPMVEELRDLVSNLSVDIAEALVGHHLAVAECAAVDSVRRALDEVPRHVSVTLRLNPEDMRAVAAYTDGLIESESIRAVADATVAHGDVVAEAGNLEVTVALDDAINQVRKALHP